MSTTPPHPKWKKSCIKINNLKHIHKFKAILPSPVQPSVPSREREPSARMQARSDAKWFLRCSWEMPRWCENSTGKLFQPPPLPSYFRLFSLSLLSNEDDGQPDSKIFYVQSSAQGTFLLSRQRHALNRNHGPGFGTICGPFFLPFPPVSPVSIRQYDHSMSPTITHCPSTWRQGAEGARTTGHADTEWIKE